jgi:hypothetical protein
MSIARAAGTSANIIRMVRDTIPARIDALEQKITTHEDALAAIRTEIAVLQTLLATVDGVKPTVL